MSIFDYSILILAVPLFAFLIIGLAGHKFKPLVAGITGTVGLTFITVLSYAIAISYFGGTHSLPSEGVESLPTIVPYLFTWLPLTKDLVISLGILLDPISVMMLVVITTISLMVHLYSLGYMKGEKGFQRFYAFLSLFTFSMLGLVLSTNIFQMYIFWELVGASSFLLIGFYYEKPSA